MSKKRACIYVLQNEWKKFIEICKREGDTASQKIGEFMRGYILRHDHGNPQTRLEPFIGKLKKKCYLCEHYFPRLNQVEFISGLVASVCNECLDQEQRKTTVKKVYGKR